MSKPGKVLKALCKKLRVRLTVKRGKKRVYKSITVLKAQCKRKAKKKKKKKKKVKRKRKFGMSQAEWQYIIMRNRATDKQMEEFWEHNDKRSFTEQEIRELRNSFDALYDREMDKMKKNAARGAGLIGLGTLGYMAYNRLRKKAPKKKKTSKRKRKFGAHRVSER